jgi:hypothetical protein
MEKKKRKAAKRKRRNGRWSERQTLKLTWKRNNKRTKPVHRTAKVDSKTTSASLINKRSRMRRKERKIVV